MPKIAKIRNPPPPFFRISEGAFAPKTVGGGGNFPCLNTPLIFNRALWSVVTEITDKTAHAKISGFKMYYSIALSQSVADPDLWWLDPTAKKNPGLIRTLKRSLVRIWQDKIYFINIIYKILNIDTLIYYHWKKWL